MNKCPNCGETSRIKEKDKFCHKCGCNLKSKSLPDVQVTTSILNGDSSLINERPLGEKVNIEEKVDETINHICDYIQELIISKTLDLPIEVAENTKALASLVEARAHMYE